MNIENHLKELNIPDILSPFGERIKSARDFESVRGKILSLLEKEEYGVMPTPPEKTWVEQTSGDLIICAGKALRRELVLHMLHDGEELSFPFRSLIPTKQAKPIPAFVLINFPAPKAARYFPEEEVIDRGYAVFDVTYSDITTDDGDFGTGIAKHFVKDRALTDAPGKITLWSYAIMRIIDYIETLDEIDMDYLAVVGHSRLGKTTLLTAAHDERVKFACSNDAGTAGDALARGSLGESIDDITRVFPFWFCPGYAKYAKHENSLPFDQHFLLSLIVPRHICLGSAEEDIWACPKNQFLSLAAASEVYKLYGKQGLIHDGEIPEGVCKYFGPDCGFYTRGGTHYLSREDWNNYIDYIDSVRAMQRK